MKRWHKLFAVLFVCLLTLGSIGYLGIQHFGKAAYADGTFTPIDLGTTFGPVDINDSGIMAGGNGWQAETWESGHASILPPLPPLVPDCLCTGASAINSSGEVVGTSGVAVGSSSTETYTHHAVRWDSGGEPVDLGGPSPTGFCDPTTGYTEAKTINDSGAVVGDCMNQDDGNSRAVYWPDGSAGSYTQLPDVSDLSSPNGAYTSTSTATGINHSNHIVGYSSINDPSVPYGIANHATFWENGTATDISPSGSDNGYAYAINDNDLAVGSISYGTGPAHPFVWDLANNHTYDLIDTYNDTDFGVAHAVNNSGIVVGNIVVPGIYNHAFMWKVGDSHVTDLNSLLPANSGWILISAVGINSSGQIVGTGLLNGQSHAFLLNTPNPSSYQLSLAPASQTATIGGGQGLVAATLLDGATSAPASNVKLSFRVEAGPNAGLSGTCFPSSCTTDTNGQLDWGYLGKALGVDTVQVWMDTNGNGVPDTGEPQTTATVTWIPPSTPGSSIYWAGYILTNTPLQPVSAVITVPTVPSTCTTSSIASFWVGFNGSTDPNTNFLPQVGFNAACYAGETAHNFDPCTGATGSSYYLWWEINPHKHQNQTNWICSLRIGPGDKVYLKVAPAPATSQVRLTAYVINPDGSFGGLPWSQTFNAPSHASYSTMECIAEDPHLATGPAPFVDFGSVEFDDCSAILDYRAGLTLTQNNIYTSLGTNGTLTARTDRITFNGPIESFTVTRIQG